MKYQQISVEEIIEFEKSAFQTKTVRILSGKNHESMVGIKPKIDKQAIYIASYYHLTD